MTKVKLVYRSLLVLINVLACIFLGLIYLGSFSMSEEAANPLNRQQVLVRMIIYGVGVSLFFSLITFLLGIIFKKKMSLDWKYLTRFFLLQFFTLIAIYAVISLFMYLK